MTYNDAIESSVSVKTAFRELTRHGFFPFESDGKIWASDNHGTHEAVATIANGEVSGAEILGWLGY